MIGSDLRAVGAGIRSWIVVMVSRLRRTSPGPALLRTTATAAGLVALTVAVPVDALSSSGVVVSALQLSLIVIPAAAGVGLFPRTRWVSVVALGALATWLVSTMVFSDQVSPVRLGLLTAALYVMHSAAALAAVLPYDSVVPARILLRWAGRVGVVLGVSLVVGVGGMVAVGQLPTARSMVGPIVGSVVAAGLVGLLAWHVRRPRT